MIEMATTDYAIVGRLTFSSDNLRDFVETSNIEAIAQQFNVPSTHLPTGKVFYYAGKYRMATSATVLVTLTITNASVHGLLYYKWDFQFGSRKNVGCNPTIEVMNWYEESTIVM